MIQFGARLIWSADGESSVAYDGFWIRSPLGLVILISGSDA